MPREMIESVSALEHLLEKRTEIITVLKPIELICCLAKE